MRNGCGDYRKEMKEEFEKSKSGNNFLLYTVLLFDLCVIHLNWD